MDIFQAIKTGDLDKVKHVVNSANINICDYDGWTPLHWAASIGHTGMVNLFISNGANIGALSNTGRSPFSVARDNNFGDIIQILQDEELRLRVERDKKKEQPKPFESLQIDSIYIHIKFK